MSSVSTTRNWQTVALGFQGTPYPTLQADGSLVLSADYVPLISSSRTAEEVNGVAFRDMPAPEHMRYFFNLLDAINKKGNRVFTFLSDPGIGKSFMADVVSNMMIGDKALRYECGDKRLGDLLFTTDLTERPEQTLYDRVLSKVAEGKAHPLSLARLKNVLGDAFDASNATVNWEAILADVSKISEIDDTFKSIAQTEGINQQATIALREDNGLIIQAYEQDRIALADEYNKGKPGSDTALQTTLQWLAREGQSHIDVKSSSGRSYELGNLDARPGFFVILTGNAATDGIGTFELSQSQNSRLQPSYLPGLGKLGLSHRFCQVMTGLPLTTLHKLYGSYFENNLEGFVLFCKGLRTLGLSQKEIESIPPHQMALIEHPMQVIEAADKCAELFSRWQNKTNLNNNNLPPNLMAELTEDYVKANTPDPRVFITLFNRALERVNRQSSKDTAIGPSFVFNPITSENLAGRGTISPIGTALMAVIAEEIKNKTSQQPNLQGMLVADAAELGVLPSAARQAQGNVKTLAQLLNVKLEPDAPINHDATRDLIKDWGAIFGATNTVQDGEQFTPFLPVIERTLSILKSDREHFVSFTANADDVDLTQAHGPFQLSNLRKVEFERRGNDVYLVNDEEHKPFENNRLLKANQLIASLTIPNNQDAFIRRYEAASGNRQKTLQAFSLLVSDDQNPDEEHTLIVLQADAAPMPRNAAGVTVTRKEDLRPAMVIIGNGPVPADLQKRLQNCSQNPNANLISYIDVSQGVNVPAVIAALRREDNHIAELAGQLGAILEPAVLQKVLASQGSMFQQAAATMTGQNQDYSKIEKIINEIIKGDGDAIHIGYVAVTAPTRTTDLMKGLRGIQSVRPDSSTSAQAAGPGGVQ